MSIKHIFIISLSCLLLACAGTDSAPDEGANPSHTNRSDCISQGTIRDYTVLNDSNLIVTADRRRKYHIVLTRRSSDLRPALAIGFSSPSGRICSTFSDIVVRGPLGVDKIRIASLRRLSPDDEDELLVRFGKKKPDFEQTPATQEVEGAAVEELD